MKGDFDVMDTSVCTMCALKDVADDLVVFRDDLWLACAVPRVPCSVTLLTIRHDARLENLTAQESGTLGPLMAAVAAALPQVWRPEQSGASGEGAYILSFGEMQPHFHAALFTREPAIADGSHHAIVGRMAELAPLEPDWHAAVPRLKECVAELMA